MENIIYFHDTRRSAGTLMGELEVAEGDQQKVTGHQDPGPLWQYNQNAKAIDHVRTKLGTYLDSQWQGINRSEDVSQAAAANPASPRPLVKPSRFGNTGVKDGEDIVTQLERYAKLKRRGLLSPEEYEAFKKKLLAQ